MATHAVPAGQHSRLPAHAVAFGHGQQPVRVAENIIGAHVAEAGHLAAFHASPARHVSGHGGSSAGGAAAAAAKAKAKAA